MLPGFLVGLAVTIGVSLVTEPPAGATEEFDEIRRAVGHPFRRRTRAIDSRAVALNRVARR